MSKPLCWWCNTPLGELRGKVLRYTAVRQGGMEVTVHKACKERCESFARQLTAVPQPSFKKPAHE